MKLTELTITGFIDILASDAPAPGGGSAAALSSSVGIALATMVAGLTIGKKKYAEHELLMKDILEKSNLIKDGLLDTINRDTEVYNKVTDVFKLPKETDEDKSLRKSAMQSALKEATKVPFDIMTLSLNALEVTEMALGKSNMNAASDLGVSALSLKAGVQSAWLNVLINLSGITDNDFVEDYKNKGNTILETALPLADKIYNYILLSL